MSLATETAKNVGKGVLKIAGAIASAVVLSKGTSKLVDVPTRKAAMEAALRENNKYYNRSHKK